MLFSLLHHCAVFSSECMSLLYFFNTFAVFRQTFLLLDFVVVVFEVMTQTVRIFVQLFEVTHIIPSPVQGHTINYPSATAASEMILARQIYASVIIKTT